MSSPGGSSEQVTIRLDAEGTAAVASALQATDRAAEQTGESLDELGREGERAGQRVERGMDAAARGTRRARDASGRFLPVNRTTADSLGRTNRKARQAARGMDTYTRSINRTTRALGGLKAMLMLVKWGAILTGGIALVGVLVALGAGAVMAVGGISPMVGILAALGPGAVAAALGIGTLAVSMADVKALMSPLAFSVLALRTEITRRLTPGITSLTTQLQSRLMPVLLAGMLGMSDSLSAAADWLGMIMTEPGTVNRMSDLFGGLDPIIQALAGTLGYLFRVLVTGSLIALPMTTRMAEGLERVTHRLSNWLTVMEQTGRGQAWLNRAWDTTIAVGKVLKDSLVGIYHIFRLAGQVAREELGEGVASATRRFREWTESAGGQQKILEFFRASVPALRETALLLGAMASGLAGLATDPNLAPLIRQIRTELGPALGRLFAQLTDTGGLGPALIHLFTAIADALAVIPIDGLIWVVQGIAGIAMSLAWLAQTVPGAGPVIGFLLSMAVAGGTLGALAGLVFKLGKGFLFLLRPLGWVAGHLAVLLYRSGLLGPLLSPITKGLPLLAAGLRAVGGALLFVGRALLLAFLTNPVGWALLAIAGLLVFLWFRFDWFRNGVKAILREVAEFFVMIWDNAFGRVALLLAAPLALFGALRGGAWLLTSVAGASRLLAVAAGPLATVLGAAAGAIRAVGTALLFVGRALLVLALANPVIAIIVIIVGLLIFMWFKFDWFREGVMTALRAIGDFFMWIFNGAVSVVAGVVAYLYGLWTQFRDFMLFTILLPVGNFFTGLWNGIESVASRVGNTISGVFRGAINLIRDAYNWIAKGWNAIPSITVPEWVPLMGGKQFGLPKLPMLWHGGTVQYDTALVGEQGPEALVHGGRVSMLGMGGPEIATGLPKGGYVVPNLDTLNRLPGLTKQIPSGVADAVSRALPHYGPAFGRGEAPAAPDVRVNVDTGSEAVVDAIETLTAVLVSQRGPAPQPDPATSLAAVLRAHDHETGVRDRYRYSSPRRPR